jgi:23S rRNA (adenine2503-C2)-methyltransferase
MDEILLTRLFPEEIAEQLQLEPYRGRQIFRWLHAKRIFDIQKMTDLSKELRSELADKAIFCQTELVHVQESQVWDKKFYFV